MWVSGNVVPWRKEAEFKKAMPVCCIQLSLMSVLATCSRMALWFINYKCSVATQVHTLGCREAQPLPNHHPLKNKQGGLSRTLSCTESATFRATWNKCASDALLFPWETWWRNKHIVCLGVNFLTILSIQWLSPHGWPLRFTCPVSFTVA